MQVLYQSTQNGLKVEKLDTGETRFTDEDGEVFVWKVPPMGPLICDLFDPRIDMTRPIFEQARRLAAYDRAEDEARRHDSDAA